jgi:hypothetical protein
MDTPEKEYSLRKARFAVAVRTTSLYSCYFSVKKEVNAMETENTEPTVEFTDENGELIIKELAKEFLTKGAWQTVMFLYQDKNPKTGEFGEPKVSIRRYQKVQGVLKQRSKFNVSGKAQAEAIIANLKKWYEL